MTNPTEEGRVTHTFLKPWQVERAGHVDNSAGAPIWPAGIHVKCPVAEGTFEGERQSSGALGRASSWTPPTASILPLQHTCHHSAATGNSLAHRVAGVPRKVKSWPYTESVFHSPLALPCSRGRNPPHRTTDETQRPPPSELSTQPVQKLLSTRAGSKPMGVHKNCYAWK